MTMLKTLLFFNNYLHDFSAGLLLSSGVAAYILYAELLKDESALARKFYLKVYFVLSKIAAASLVYIFFGGIIRTVSYKNMEWSKELGAFQVPLLVAKHVILFAFVGAGCSLWLKLRAKVKILQKNVEAKEREKTYSH